MTRSILTVLTAILMLATGFATAAAGSIAPVGPVTNGDFEGFAAPDEVKAPLQGTPADECIGIGHQVHWGTDTPQGELTGTTFDDVNEAEPDPDSLADRYDGEPVDQAQSDAEEQSGYGHCEFNDEKGHDQVWLNPASAGGTTEDTAAFWSNVGHEDSPTRAGFTFDHDPFDKEVKIVADGSKSSHNFWQSFANRQQAWTANFDALEFDVEDGSIVDGASVKISLAAEPLNVQEPYAVVYFDCVLTFDSDYLQASLNDGTVSASPVGDGVHYDGEDDPDCPDELSRESLGRLSIIQLSFWRFNQGEEPIVIDNVGLPGATMSAEEAADGNARVCPDSGVDAIDDNACEPT